MAKSLPRYVSRNGELISPDQACVSVFTPALYGAYGVYESIQITQGVIFAGPAHLERLARSARLLDMTLPADLATFAAWMRAVIEANETVEGNLRLFVVGAENGDEVTAFLWPEPPIVYPQEYYTQGVATITFEGRRFLPQAKSLNSLVSYVARRTARAAGAHEALLHSAGCLTEGSNSNLFAVVDDVVITPPADQVLAGVTRDLLFAIAADAGIALRENPLALADLPRWRESFITSTSRHIMPVTSIDGRPVGNGSVGPITQRLMAAFEAYFVREVNALRTSSI